MLMVLLVRYVYPEEFFFGGGGGGSCYFVMVGIVCDEC